MHPLLGMARRAPCRKGGEDFPSIPVVASAWSAPHNLPLHGCAAPERAIQSYALPAITAGICRHLPISALSLVGNRGHRSAASAAHSA